MIDSTRLLPPVSGLSTNPILFGVSEGLARLLPLPEDDTFASLQPAALGEDPAPGPAPAAPMVEAGPTA
ncbi:hypothetical protein GU700_22565 [Methylobacterium sp. NI91]|nr:MULTISPECIES: hypothetical protein [unclassified Methylobacterium]QIJ77107.1 hypothetical protein CLZ_22570 [Methylobacterium sp. CLZ]QIJ82011.1 hypothetical protein GU700_22565 [Methylobacterium sp. NI91]